MSLIRLRRSLPEAWIVLANSVCLPVRLPSGLRESWSERMRRLRGGRQPLERRELEAPLDLAREEYGQHEEVRRTARAEPGRDSHVTGGHVAQQDLVLLARALADESLPGPNGARERALPTRVAR